MQDDDRNEGRLSRWSKRKIASARQSETDAGRVDAPPSEDAEVQARHAAELAANREAAEAVDLDALDADSDFSVFLKKGVPEILKKRAMSVLWRSNPVLANVDGLVDYDDDFGSPDLLMKTFKSAYQAGRGYLEHQEREAKSNAAAEDGVVADASTEEDPEPKEEDDISQEPVAEDSGQDSDPGMIAADSPDADGIEAGEVEAPLPKVSLRKRLQLDSKT